VLARQRGAMLLSDTCGGCGAVGNVGRAHRGRAGDSPDAGACEDRGDAERQDR
jgi:hypothetical protein